MAKLRWLNLLLSVASLCSAYCQEAPRRRPTPSLAAPWHQRARKLRENSASGKDRRTNAGVIPKRWEAEGEGAEAAFGYHVAAAGDVNADGFADVVICEPGFSNGVGKVCVYYGSKTGLPSRPNWIVVGQVEATNGIVHNPRGNAEGVGDVNGDGFEDLVLVAEAYNRSNTNLVNSNDQVRIYSGSSTGLLTTASWIFTASELGGLAVVSAGRAGDVNGDGFADLYVVLAADGLDPTNRHSICILYGSRGGVHLSPRTTAVLDPLAGPIRPSLACAGDVNGDGYADLVVGEAVWSNSNHWCGRALLFSGSATGLVTEASWSATYELPLQKGVDEAYEQQFGWSVAGAGDVNGDGFEDVLIGAPFADHGDVNEGLAFVYFGSPTGLSSHARWFTESNHPHALLGITVSRAGDVNGDGFSDVMVDASQASDGQINEGAVVAFLGSKTGPASLPHWSVESDHSNEMLGESIAAVGDVNGDGYDDVLIGSRRFGRVGANNIGRAMLYYGSPDGLTGSFNWRIDKPPLLALQQWWERSNGAWALAALSGLMVVCIGTVVGWRRALVRQRRAERENTRAQERERIARDMHDHLGANLGQIVLWSELSKRAAEPAAPVDSALERVNQSAQSAMKYLRELVQTMTPSTASLAGFADHLADLAQQCLEPTQIKLHLEFPDSFPALQLHAEARSHVSMMIKEALHNVVKHAGAREVRFRLECQRHALEITILDDGRGFESKASESVPNGNGGNGLRNLRSRTLSLGGQLKIDTQPGRGTTLKITLPLARLRAAG